MNLREWINNNSALVTIIAVVVLVICLGLIIWNLKPQSYSPVDVYYYDLSSGEIFVASGAEMPPIDAPSGATVNGHPAGVRAHVYACGECPSGLAGMTVEQVQQAGAYVAYLEMYDPRVKAAMEQAQAQAESGQMTGPPPEILMGAPGMGSLVKAPAEEAQWVQMYTEQGMQLQQAAAQCPDGGTPQTCRP